jgi:1-deoxy-D-xylulose-5-phosphate reductoisomerase
LRAGAGAPTVLNAANEVAVAEFLAGQIRFCGIAALVEATLEASASHGLLHEPSDMDEALAIDEEARRLARELLPEIAAKTI